MQLNKLSGTSSTTSIYFDAALQADNAVWGFIPNKNWINILGQSIPLNTTWNSNQGYYVFFPAAQRGSGWSQFISKLSSQMTSSNRRFGFFDAQGGGLGFLSVTGSGNSQALSIGNNFQFRNISLNVTAIQGLVSATFDDAASTFKIARVSSGDVDSIAWMAAPGGAGARKIIPLSDLKIPVSGPTPGALVTELALSLDDQSAFETGPMYFAPPNNGGGLTVLRYPNFIAGGTAEEISVTTYLDPALFLDAQRTYFKLNDKDLKTAFSSSIGRQIILSPLDGASDPDGISSRFVFSNRPVNQVDDNAAYYLTPYGSFTVGMTGTTDEGELLCAYSATETFTFSRGDTLRFVPGNAAYRVNIPATAENGVVYLTEDATTSWLGLSASTAAQNIYYSQPQGSPIYQNNGQTGDGAANGYTAYQLSFRKIPVYPAQDPAIALETAATPTPLVPMVPYGGISTSDDSAVNEFQLMETKGINPQRRLVLKSLSENKSFAPQVGRTLAEDAGTLVNSMTPLGLIGGFDQNSNVWMNTQFAVSGSKKDKVLRFEDMQDELRSALYQNQIFLVIDQNNSGAQKLFTFGDTDATVELSDWFFDLQLQGQDPDGVPPILLLKFFRDKSIKELVDDQSLWADATTFSSAPSERQAQLQKIIDDAESAGMDSVYANFNTVVNDPAFAGLLAINTALKLDDLPPVIRALLGGMIKEDGTSNLAAFRAHHVGVNISDTGNSETVTLDSSSVFALVDYEDDSTSNTSLSVRTMEPDERMMPAIYGEAAGLDYYGFKVIYLRALFENNALTSFEAEVDLTVNNLFAVAVNLGDSAGNSEADDEDNIIKIKGSYSEHDGAQTYSFVAEKTYEFTYDDNTYLKNIIFEKVQFSATEDTATGNTAGDGADSGATSKISSRFAIWGSMEFNKLEFLDMFSFEKLSFADLGIEMSYLLTTYTGGKPPETSDLALKFAPGNLRFDFGETEQRTDDDSMLALLPFKLQSFLYSENGQSISELDYFEISLETLGITPQSQPPASSTFNFGLIFDLELGSLGALVGDLSAFKFSIFLGWQPPSGSKPNALIFGVQMPEADGKLELNIEGVLKIFIEQFQLKWTQDTEDKLLVLAFYNSYMEVLGTRMPPGNIFFDFALFAPTKGENKIGWLAAFNKEAEEEKALAVSMNSPIDAARQLKGAENGDDGGSKVFDLEYLGVGQRVGPDENPTNFDEFLEYVRTDFWTAVNSGKYGDVYKPDGGWMVVANFVLLDIVGLGFVFYDSTPFYSLKIYITQDALKGLSFEITYTKVNDNVGLFFINFTLPDTLRTFQAGAASITLPALKLSIYTNSDFKIDLGFPANDDWTVCFRVEAFVGPIPVTGSGGFYIAKLSSATDDTFTNKYDMILAAGFGARLGVGKDFTSGPFKAGVSLTFFGIVEGKIGYYAYNGTEDVVKWLTDPKALSLQGQFGVIGELYGTVDFAIIKASVNVQIQASIGIQLLLESGMGGDILLYVEASVSVSVKVKIDLGLFSIKVSFSFKASFRFEWKLLNSNNSNSVERLLYSAEWAALETTLWNPDYPLQNGLTNNLGTWMTPEITSVWSDPSAAGEPWFVVSLTMEYVNDTESVTTPSQFKSFENVAAQTVAWALNASLGLASWSDTVTQEQIDALNQDPDKLVGGLDYTTLIEGLGKMFALSITSVPPDDGKTTNADKETKYATIFPMLPFLGLNTSGRGAELSYVFQNKSNVSEQWTQNELQEYFAQLYTNITSGGDSENLLAADVATIPLIQSVFLDWFQALVRSTVNALLTQMQNDESESGKLSDIYIAAVKSGQIRNVAGQMSQFFRSGLRLPETAGMELPEGSLQPTNPLYALVWQEFPVGNFTDGKQYVINLVGDNNQTWVSVDAKWTLLNSDVTPYEIVGTTIDLPGTPTSIPVLQTGPQAFSLANPITWTPSGGKATTLRPFSKAMSDALKASSPLKVKLLSRETTKAYDLETNPVPSADVRWALSVEMTVRKVPLGGDAYLPNTYALGAADLTVQNAMRDLLAALGGNSSLVKSIKLLYQQSSDTSGLISFPITTNPPSGQLFVLRTNTTTQSVPPPTLMAMAEEETHTTQVGADTGDPYGFLQILEQSSVTNQTGYFLTYETADGKSLPTELFGNQTFAPVTFLFELDVPAASDEFSLERYVNAVVLDNTVEGQLYYAETTEAQNETSYVSTAAGSAGVELTRKEPGETTIPDKLAQLYSLVAYQVPASSGFIASNLSVPSGPQKQDETDTDQQWRLSVPLYKLATENQSSVEQNRYASIGDNYSIQTLVVDAFGNAFGRVQTTVSNQPNLYFDDLIPMGNWTGVRSIFNFQAWSSPTDNTVCNSLTTGSSTVGGTPQANKFSVYLCPSKDALPAPGSQSADATASLYRTIIDQLTPDDVLLFVTTNLNSTNSDIDLSADQKKAVLDMLGSIGNYLEDGTGTLSGVTLTVTVPGSSDALALVFEIQADFGIRRTKNVSPEVADYPNAFRATTNVPPQSDVDLNDLAADFSTAFAAFGLATGPADATDVSVGMPMLEDASDNAASTSQPKGLWAVSKKVTDLTLSSTVRYYLAPKPLDTSLRSGTVSMPNDLTALSGLPDKRTFNDVDLDDIARTAFAAVDAALGAESASNMFQKSQDLYSQVAYAREDIADRYADNEVTWLLQDSAYMGDASDLCQGQDQMAQQMRAALSSAYAVNTIVQTKVAFNQPLPSNMGNRLQLFGQMQRPTDGTVSEDAGGFGLGTARVDVPSGNGGQATTTTFLYGVTDQKIENNRYQEFPLEWAVSHLQVFLEDRVIDYCEHGEAAPPSIWLQLINSFPSPPKMGDTIIPLAYREYPTPPTMIVQTAKRDTDDTGTTLADQTRWIYTSTYQARLSAADEITLQLIYNTGGSTESVDMFKTGEEDAEKTYTLFEALTRFQSGYQILQPQMSPITKDTPIDVLTAFATLVTQLANNSDWMPKSEMLTGSGAPVFTLEQDIVTDRKNDDSDERLITLTPDPLALPPNPWVGDKCITALDPATMKPYPDEQESCSTPGQKIVTHAYTPVPPPTSNFVTHQVKVKGLTTLLYENGNSGIGVRRNASLYPDDTVLSNTEFIYQTPIVALTNPLTPFVDNPTPVAIYPAVVNQTNLDLGDYVRLTLEAMMGLTETNAELLTQSEGTTDLANRRLKIDARYGFPIGSPSGSSLETDYFLPLYPAILVRSFDLPVDGLQEELTKWVGKSGDSGTSGIKPYSAVLADWLQNSDLALGQPTSPDAPPKGAILVLDVTLYSQLNSGTNQLPLLRLSDLRLDLSVVAAPGSSV
ncbi:MAG TPA: hypothetical protein VF604_01810 [Pyrinomonadaceae bacterium]